MSGVKQFMTALVVHVLLLGVYAFAFPLLPESTGNLLRTVLGFVVIGTTLTITQHLLTARLAPLEPTLQASAEGRRELLWRTANHEPRLTKIEGWPSWTLSAYRYGTFGVGMAAVVAALIYVTRSGEALTFSVLPLIAGFIALVSSLPYLVSRTVFERWAVTNPEKVTTLLSSHEAQAAPKSASLS